MGVVGLAWLDQFMARHISLLHFSGKCRFGLTCSRGLLVFLMGQKLHIKVQPKRVFRLSQGDRIQFLQRLKHFLGE